MPSDLERAISQGTEMRERLWSLEFAMIDDLDEPDPPTAQDLPLGRTHFSTYAEARRTFITVLSEDFAPKIFMHQMIIMDYCSALRWDVQKDISFLRSLGEGSCASGSYPAAVLERWESWRAVEQRWPYRVPDDCSAMRKEQLEMLCREMWTAIRGVGMTALVIGEGKPGDAPFPCTPDGYGAHSAGYVSVGAWGLCRLFLRSVGVRVWAGKSIKQD